MSTRISRRNRSGSIQRGDVFEILTPSGRAYLQYVNRDAQMGEFVRVLSGIYDTVPQLRELALQRERFTTFFPLTAARSKGIVQWVANTGWPPEHDRFPVLRSPGYVNPKTGEIESWWLWDGEKAWRTDGLTDEQRKLSLKSVMNDTLLIERIVSGWEPADFR